MNPWFDPKNPYITNKGWKTIVHKGPNACVTDEHYNPYYSPESVDESIERFMDIADEHSSIAFEARLRERYLRWRKWEEDNK